MIQEIQNAGPKRTLSLFDAICIIVGTIIGAGIFQTAPLIASNAGNFQWMIGLWLAGGMITVIGALCFAELTTRFSDLAGGDYGYLKMSYGRPVGFMFAWATFWIIRPGNIGAMALTFASYFDRVLGFDAADNQFRVAVYTLSAVLVLSGFNLIGLRQGKWIQNVLTVVKVLGIGAIISVAFFTPSSSAPGPANPVQFGAAPNLGLALVFVMFSFGGWNDISFVSTELKSPERNLFRALLYGSVLVTAIYVVVNCAFVASLGFNQMTESGAVATDVTQKSFGTESVIGRTAAQLIAALICVSCLGAINGIIITSPRIYYAAGKDYSLPVLSHFGRWDLKRDQPWIATMVQAVVTIGFCLLCFQYENPFEVILIASAPFFWAFLGLAGLTVIVLRLRVPVADYPEAFKVPLYPLSPILLAVACFGMAYSSFDYMLKQGYWLAIWTVFGTMLAGIIMGLLIQSKSKNLDRTKAN